MNILNIYYRIYKYSIIYTEIYKIYDLKIWIKYNLLFKIYNKSVVFKFYSKYINARQF